MYNALCEYLRGFEVFDCLPATSRCIMFDLSARKALSCIIVTLLFLRLKTRSLERLSIDFSRMPQISLLFT